MLRRAWKPLTASVALAGSAYWYYSTTQTPSTETFELPVREQGPDGKPVKVMRRFPLLPKSVIEARLTEQATLDTHYSSPDGRTWKSTTARVASNNPIEDAHAHGLHPRLPGSPDQRMFFAVMDGHAGFHTSQLLSRILIPAVALELSQAATPSTSVYERVKLALSFGTSGPSKELPPGATARAVQKAFTDLDYEIISAPLKLLVTNVDQVSLRKGLIPDLSQNPMALPVMQPAMSGMSTWLPLSLHISPILGSCALMAILDPASQDLHVACTGDARAVAGYWEETADGSGRWRVEVMSEDQTGRNPNELKRYDISSYFEGALCLTSISGYSPSILLPRRTMLSVEVASSVDSSHPVPLETHVISGLWPYKRRACFLFDIPARLTLRQTKQGLSGGQWYAVAHPCTTFEDASLCYRHACRHSSQDDALCSRRRWPC